MKGALQAGSGLVLDNQVAAIKSEFMINVNSVYELRALVFELAEVCGSEIIGERILKIPTSATYCIPIHSINVYPLENNEATIGMNLLSPENESCEDAELA